MTTLAATPSTSSSPAPVQSQLLLWSAAGLLATANFLAVLDITIANVSVPNIAGNLGVSSSQGLWVITSYAVAEAITVPLTGWLAGRFGALRVFCTAMAGFGLFSALCGLSTSLEMLVPFRVLQGVVTQIALASVDLEETAAAAGVMSFIRTLSSAVTTSIVNTVWESGANYNQSELAGTLNGASSAIDGLMQNGMSHDQAIGTLTNIAYGQAVMLSTNQVFLAAAMCFLVAAAAIRLAPRPTRIANPAMAH